MRAAMFALGGAIMALGLMAGSASAQNVVNGERYVPGIWVDPDGCEHWVMDDGAEGYMT
ncbi:MAG TPA: OmpA family protein, partial [Aliiroseovarius sp.]|nr:OmpA family protein [Aliiroseovarius sp.]